MVFSGISFKSCFQLLNNYYFIGSNECGFNAFFIRNDIKSEHLNEEKDLLQKIRIYVKNKSEMEEKCTACFGIFSTSYEQDYVYVLQYASFIQEEKID